LGNGCPTEGVGLGNIGSSLVIVVMDLRNHFWFGEAQYVVISFQGFRVGLEAFSSEVVFVELQKVHRAHFKEVNTKYFFFSSGSYLESLHGRAHGPVKDMDSLSESLSQVALDLRGRDESSIRLRRHDCNKALTNKHRSFSKRAHHLIICTEVKVFVFYAEISSGPNCSCAWTDGLTDP